MKRRGKRKYRKCIIGKGKIWDNIKNFFKKTKILSTAAKLIPGVGSALGNVIGNVGYGRKRGRRRRRRRHRIGGMSDEFKKLFKSHPVYTEKHLNGGPDSIPKNIIRNADYVAEKVHPRFMHPKINWYRKGTPNLLKKGSGRRSRRYNSSESNLDNRYIDNKIRVL